jgi:hypothetical protein
VTTKKPIYPDISDILARKVEGPRDAAKRSFGEKIAWVERMRQDLAPFKRLREERRAAQNTGGSKEIATKKPLDRPSS